MENITFEYDVSEEDYINFNIFHMNNSKQGKKVKLILMFVPLMWFFVFIFVIRLIFQSITSELPLEYNLTGIYIIAAIVTATLAFTFPKRYEKKIRKALKIHISEGKGNDFIGHQKLILHEDSIESVSSDTAAYVKYTAVERVESAYNCIYIYIGAVKAFIIPLAAFSDAEQKNNFVKIIQEKTKIDISRYLLKSL